MNVGQQIEVDGQLYKVQRVLDNGQYVLAPFDPARSLRNPQFVINGPAVSTITVTRVTY